MSAENPNLLVRPSIAHHSNGPNWKEDSKRLRYFIVQPGVANFFDVDIISLLEDPNLLSGYGTKNTYS